MANYQIRLVGDPVLKQRAEPVTDIDGGIVKLAKDMVAPLREAEGLALAAPQVGVLKRLFVYEMKDSGPRTIVNPQIVETRGEWEYEEGCLSIPGLHFNIVRPKEIHLVGYDLDGNELSIEADELMARMLQHEYDHLEGRLMLELLDKDQKKQAKKALRSMQLRTA